MKIIILSSLLILPLVIPLFDMGNIEFFIGKKRYNIPLDCLKVVPIQQYVFYNKGITKINGDNIYNVEDCGDVIAMVHFVY